MQQNQVASWNDRTGRFVYIPYNPCLIHPKTGVHTTVLMIDASRRAPDRAGACVYLGGLSLTEACGTVCNRPGHTSLAPGPMVVRLRGNPSARLNHSGTTEIAYVACRKAGGIGGAVQQLLDAAEYTVPHLPEGNHHALQRDAMTFAWEFMRTTSTDDGRTLTLQRTWENLTTADLLVPSVLRPFDMVTVPNQGHAFVHVGHGWLLSYTEDMGLVASRVSDLVEDFGAFGPALTVQRAVRADECHCCFAPISKEPVVCEGCGVWRYCSRRCQDCDSGRHRTVCHAGLLEDIWRALDARVLDSTHTPLYTPETYRREQEPKAQHIPFQPTEQASRTQYPAPDARPTEQIFTTQPMTPTDQASVTQSGESIPHAPGPAGEYWLLEQNTVASAPRSARALLGRAWIGERMEQDPEGTWVVETKAQMAWTCTDTAVWGSTAHCDAFRFLSALYHGPRPGTYRLSERGLWAVATGPPMTFLGAGWQSALQNKACAAGLLPLHTSVPLDTEGTQRLATFVRDRLFHRGPPNTTSTPEFVVLAWYALDILATPALLDAVRLCGALHVHPLGANGAVLLDMPMATVSFVAPLDATPQGQTMPQGQNNAPVYLGPNNNSMAAGPNADPMFPEVAAGLVVSVASDEAVSDGSTWTPVSSDYNTPTSDTDASGYTPSSPETPVRSVSFTPAVLPRPVTWSAVAANQPSVSNSLLVPRSNNTYLNKTTKEKGISDPRRVAGGVSFGTHGPRGKPRPMNPAKSRPTPPSTKRTVFA